MHKLDALCTFKDHGSLTFIIKSLADHSLGIYNKSTVYYSDYFKLLIFCFDAILLFVFNNLLKPIYVDLKGI
jgi:hypothetical protein